MHDFGSEIVNCRVSSAQISQYRTDISYTVFLRYFISDFVKEDRNLYGLDMVVTGSLDDLFTMDLKGYPVAKSPEIMGTCLLPITEKSSMQAFLVIEMHTGDRNR